MTTWPLAVLLNRTDRIVWHCARVLPETGRSITACAVVLDHRDAVLDDTGTYVPSYFTLCPDCRAALSDREKEAS